jgi:biotin carboxyl carrier protein
MILHIEAAGRRRAVEVVRVADTFLVSIDGRDHEVDVKVIDGILSLLIGTRSYEALVGPSRDGVFTVHVDGVPVELSLPQSRPAEGRPGPRAPEESGPQKVTAPMPGKIVKVLVKPGDRVEPRQGLVVVEAMKMENELRSRSAGTVIEVRAFEGGLVEAGAILVILE